LPVFLQSVKRLDAFHTGLTLLPMSLMLLIVSPAAAGLTKRIAHKRLVQAGLVINVIAIIVLRFTITMDVKLVWLIPGLSLYGIGLGLVLSQINNLTLSAVPLRDAGEASGVTNTFRQVGMTLGAAVIGAILISTILVRLDSAVEQSPSIPQESKPPIIATLRQHATGLAFGEGSIFEQFPSAIRDEMIARRRVATTEGIQRAFVVGAFFAMLGLGVSTLLPMRPSEQHH
jgi:MFS family permease